MAKIFPWGACLAGLAALFVSFSVFTSNTGNILAWGFEGLPSLQTSLPGLISYEFSHTSPAYGALLVGLWLIGVVGIVSFARGQVDERGMCWICGGVLLTGLVSFMVLNGILYTYPDSSRFEEYLSMALTNPWVGEENAPSPARFWWLAIPLLLALVSVALPAFRNKAGTLLACGIAIPTVVFSWPLSNYLAHHLLCFGSPDVFTTLFEWLAWPLMIIPPVACLVIIRRADHLTRS